LPGHSGNLQTLSIHFRNPLDAFRKYAEYFPGKLEMLRTSGMMPNTYPDHHRTWLGNMGNPLETFQKHY
jgi:hypothetical protein